jgi:hypothetical protein
MGLQQSAKLNGRDPWAYLRDVIERLPSHPNNRIEELLTHRWAKPEAWHPADVTVTVTVTVAAPRRAAPRRGNQEGTARRSLLNNDAVLTSALLDRLLHHAETILLEEKG